MQQSIFYLMMNGKDKGFTHLHRHKSLDITEINGDD